MSLYACDVHGKRVPGSLESAYPTLLRGTARLTRRVRLCPDHMDSFLGAEHCRLVPIADIEQGVPLGVCGACGQEGFATSALDSLFVTVYRRGEERSDYFTTLCGPCGDLFVTAWKLSSD